MVALPVAVLDSGALLGWLGIGKTLIEGDWEIGAAVISEAALSEALHFLAVFHDNDVHALQSDLLSIQFAPMLTAAVLPLAAQSASELAVHGEWGLATSVAVARAQALPLVSFANVEADGVFALRMQRRSA